MKYLLVATVLACPVCHTHRFACRADSRHVAVPKIKRRPFFFRRNNKSIKCKGSCLFLRCGGESAGEGVVAAQQSRDQTATTTNNQQSPFEYIPITALDDYGSSTQLRHAMESANKFGTPVLACICCHNGDDDNNNEGVENAIVVCSLQRPRPGVISSSPSTSSVVSISSTNKLSHPSIQGMVRPLATRDDINNPTSSSDDNDIPKHALHTAIVTTGIQSDANFLLNQLQTHISKYWFRYDTLPSPSSGSATTQQLTVIKMVRDILLDCLGYDWTMEVNSGQISGGIGSAAPSYDEGEDGDENGGSSRAGRPLGVCTFLLGLDFSMKAHLPFLTVVKANGASQQYVAHAMGVGSQLANDRLSQKWRRCMSQNEAKDMMKEILKEVAMEKGWLTDGGDDGTTEGKKGSGLNVACEIVTSRGIEIEYIPL